jgi:hypothetical protein
VSSGDYEFRLLTDPKVLQDDVAYEGHGAIGLYTMAAYTPQLRFSSLTTTLSDNYPPEMGNNGWGHSAANKLQAPGYNVKYVWENPHFVNLHAKEALPGYYLTMQDQLGGQHYIGHYTGRVQNPTIDGWAYDGHTSNLFPLSLPGFAVVRSDSEVPHAVTWMSPNSPAQGVTRLLPIAHNAYRTAHQILGTTKVSVISLAEAKAQRTAGRIRVRTGKRSTQMTEREISLTDLTVTKCTLGPRRKYHLDENYEWLDRSSGFHFKWKTNLPTDNQHLHVEEKGIWYDIHDLSGMPDRVASGTNVRYPVHYQKSSGYTEENPGIFNINLMLGHDEEMIPLGELFPVSAPQSLGLSVQEVDNYNKETYYTNVVQYAVLPENVTAYPNKHIMYFSPIDPAIDLGDYEFRFLEKTIMNEPVWIHYNGSPIYNNGIGLVVDVTGIDPGHYAYRFVRKSNPKTYQSRSIALFGRLLVGICK